MTSLKSGSFLKRLLPGAAAVSILLAGATWTYHSAPGLWLRAALGQASGVYLQARALYEKDDLAGALRGITPLVEAGHVPSLVLICGFTQSRLPQSDIDETCVSTLQNDQIRGLDELTELAIWAQEWDVAEEMLVRRLGAGDLSAHFDRARLISAAPPGYFGGEALYAALEASNSAEDPRGQYAAVLRSISTDNGSALDQVVVEILLRRPKFKPADAYFELSKLMQMGAISSDLSYVEVLRRADGGGNPYAAGHLAQYFLANPGEDPEGAERQHWIAKAAGSGDPVAQYNHAIELMKDQADSARMQEAVRFLDRSAAAGFVPALNMLGATLWQNPSLLDGLPDGVDPMALMKSAADQGDANANFNIGNIHLFDNKREEAMPYLQTAAKLGNQSAADLLLQLAALSPEGTDGQSPQDASQVAPPEAQQ